MKTKHILTLSFLTFSLYSFGQVGLLGSYPFNGNANDVSGNGNNGVVTGATLTTDRFGNPNSAYLFNGINTFIDIGNNFAYNSHSFSCWARRDSAVNGCLISKLNNGPYDLQNSEYYYNGVTIGTGTTWAWVGSSVTTIDYSQWNCYVATYNATTNVAKIYANGIVDSMVVGNYSDVINTPIFIGARPYWNGTGGPAFFFKGAIDEVNIYNRVLTQQEVDSLCPTLTAINLNLNARQLSIFPNPFSAQTVLHSDNLLHNATLTVYNSFGQTVQIDNISGQTVTLFRDNLTSGLYFLRLTTEGKIIFVDKLVITDK